MTEPETNKQLETRANPVPRTQNARGRLRKQVEL